MISTLKESLSFLESSDDFSEDAKIHARELRKLLCSKSSNDDSKTSASESEEDSKASSNTSQNGTHAPTIDHTAVPPPFPTVKAPPPIHTGKQPSPPTTNSLPALPPITDLKLLSAPFTHTSTLPHYIAPTNINTYEPLEFLGDAYLEVIATRLIHNRFPAHTVGQKSGLREILIRNDTLAVYSRDYGFGDKVQIAGVERESMGKGWTKILADVFEAYVACVILSDAERGFETCEAWLQRLWEPRIKEWEEGPGKNSGEQEHLNLDVKSVLQRYLVSKGVKLEYVEERPMEHVKDGNRTTFFMGVYLTGWGYNRVRLGSGSGRSKQIAGAEAAKDAFVRGKAIIEVAHARKLEQDRIFRPRNKMGGFI